MKTHTGKTQAMLEQVISHARTEGHVGVVAMNRTHARELYLRLKSMGASSRDGEILQVGGNLIWILTPRNVVRIGLHEWGMRGRASVKVFVDHAAYQVL